MAYCTVICFVALLHLVIVCIQGQNLPVFIGQNTPPVPSPIAAPQIGLPGAMAAQVGGPGALTQAGANPNSRFVGNAFTVPLHQTEQWAPGEPVWFFPSTPAQWIRSCQRTGCPAIGSHCVFWGTLCPSSVRRVPCRCLRGCRVDTNFIPYGQSRVMDRCNNICTCRSREGIPVCTARRC